MPGEVQNGMPGSEPSPLRPSDTNNSKNWTTNSGAPVYNNDESLAVGDRGPILLEDYHLVEKLSQFDRERIPERVVHARGATAKGYFEVTHDISHLSCAKLFSEIGKRTPVATRFSTVIHSRHSPETLRDPRGFAVKFYTEDGNWDLVGNNFPVFFIRDGIKFPDMVHALKPNPRTDQQEFWRVWDFFSHHPESTHMFTFLLDDLGVPKNYRHMRGSGVHTFSLVDKDGKVTLVKFHWVPTLPEECLLGGDTASVVDASFSHATKDLMDSIDNKDYPEWKFCIQTMDPEKQNDYDFDPLDATKIWPVDQFPMQPVGRMVLDRNVDNFFLENEQIAFSPAVIVPGIYYSDDHLLQTRLYSYADTQRYRVGPNYLLLPINAPRNKHHNNHFDGPMNFMHRQSEVNYEPSREEPAPSAPEYPIPKVVPNSNREKVSLKKRNDYKQAGDNYRSFDEKRKMRFIERVSDALNEARVSQKSKEIWLKNWAQADASLGKELAQRVKLNRL